MAKAFLEVLPQHWAKTVNYLQRINLGYDRENLLYIPIEGAFTSKYSTFKEVGSNAPGVKMVSKIGEAPTSVRSATFAVEWIGKEPNTAPQFTNIAVGYDFVKTMNLKLLDGRDYSKNFVSDSTGYLINESALKIIGYKDPIGKPLTFWGQKGHRYQGIKAALMNPVKSLKME